MEYKGNGVSLLASKSLKLASAVARKFESEKEILHKRISELEKQAELNKLEARAQKIALRLTLDEDAIKDIINKTASLMKDNMDVVEKAIELNESNKLASLGEVEDKLNQGPVDPKMAFYLAMKK